MATFDGAGLKIDSLDEVLEFLKEKYRSVYGEDVNLDPNTPDGNWVEIEAKLNADLQESVLDVYNSLDLDLAIGNQLNKLAKFLGIIRRPASKSLVEVEITSNSTVALPDSYTLVDTLGQNWIIRTPQTIPAGTTLIEFESDLYGAFEAGANTIIEQGTVLLPITSVNNPSPATVGAEEETDREFRIRIKQSLRKPSFSTVGGLLGELLDLENVTDCIIYENATGSYDFDRDMISHSIWVVIEGGLDGDVAGLIAREKTLGCGLKGQTVVTHSETVGAISVPTEVKFDRPTEIPVYINLTLSPKIAGSFIDQVPIKNALAEVPYRINEDVIVTSLYGIVYGVSSSYIATGLEVSRDGISFTSDVLSAGYDEKFTIDQSNINIVIS